MTSFDDRSAFGDVFRGRRVLVTGHTGFKGAWLSLWLVRLGARVAGFSLPPRTERDLFSRARLAQCMDSRFGDIRDFSALARAVQETSPSVIFHLAAQPLVRASYRLPRETFDTNVMGTVNLLEAACKTDSVRVCQIITSDKCYANDPPKRHAESDPMGGHDPYSASKGCAELAVDSYRRCFGKEISISSVRAGNVIGGGDWAEDRIVPDCVRAFAAGGEVVLRNPRATRPWQHVLEPLSGYLWLASRQLMNPSDFADSFNFGPLNAESAPVAKVVETLATAWGDGRWRVQEDPAAPHESATLELDCSKAREALGWAPVMSLEEALAATAEWYRREHQDSGFDAESYSLSQIASYEAKAGAAGLPWASRVRAAA